MKPNHHRRNLLTDLISLAMPMSDAELLSKIHALEALPPIKKKAVAVFHGLDWWAKGPTHDPHVMDIENCEVCRAAYEKDPDAFDASVVPAPKHGWCRHCHTRPAGNVGGLCDECRAADFEWILDKNERGDNGR